MTSDQITSVLAKLFEQDGYRIVFWNEAGQEFGDFTSKTIANASTESRKRIG